MGNKPSNAGYAMGDRSISWQPDLAFQVNPQFRAHTLPSPVTPGQFMPPPRPPFMIRPGPPRNLRPIYQPAGIPVVGRPSIENGSVVKDGRVFDGIHKLEPDKAVKSKIQQQAGSPIPPQHNLTKKIAGTNDSGYATTLDSSGLRLSSLPTSTNSLNETPIGPPQALPKSAYSSMPYLQPPSPQHPFYPPMMPQDPYMIYAPSPMLPPPPGSMAPPRLMPMSPDGRKKKGWKKKGKGVQGQMYKSESILGLSETSSHNPIEMSYVMGRPPHYVSNGPLPRAQSFDNLMFQGGKPGSPGPVGPMPYPPQFRPNPYQQSVTGIYDRQKPGFQKQSQPKAPQGGHTRNGPMAKSMDETTYGEHKYSSRVELDRKNDTMEKSKFISDDVNDDDNNRTTAEIHHSTDQIKASKGSPRDAIYETLKQGQNSSNALNFDSGFVKVTPEAKQIMERNAGILGVQPFTETELQGSVGIVREQKHSHVEKIDEVTTEGKTDENVILPINFPTIPKRKREKIRPRQFPSLEAWESIDVSAELKSRQSHKQTRHPEDTAGEDLIVPNLSPAAPSRRQANEPIYLEYDDRLLPDFKKRLIETGSFDFVPEKHGHSLDSDLSGKKGNNLQSSRNDSDSYKNPVGDAVPVDITNIPQPKKNWKAFVMQDSNAYYPAHSESSMLRKFNSSDNIQGHSIEVQEPPGNKGSLRQLKNSMANVFRRSRSSERDLEGKVGEPNLSVPFEASPDDEVTPATPVDNSVIDFSWVDDLENKFKKSQVDQELMKQQRDRLERGGGKFKINEPLREGNNRPSNNAPKSPPLEIGTSNYHSNESPQRILQNPPKLSPAHMTSRFGEDITLPVNSRSLYFGDYVPAENHANSGASAVEDNVKNKAALFEEQNSKIHQEMISRDDQMYRQKMQSRADYELWLNAKAAQEQKDKNQMPKGSVPPPKTKEAFPKQNAIKQVSQPANNEPFIPPPDYDMDDLETPLYRPSSGADSKASSGPHLHMTADRPSYLPVAPRNSPRYGDRMESPWLQEGYGDSSSWISSSRLSPVSAEGRNYHHSSSNRSRLNGYSSIPMMPSPRQYSPTDPAALQADRRYDSTEYYRRNILDERNRKQAQLAAKKQHGFHNSSSKHATRTPHAPASSIESSSTRGGDSMPYSRARYDLEY